MTGPLTLAVRAKLWNELSALALGGESVLITALFMHRCNSHSLSGLSPQVSWVGARKHLWAEYNEALKPFRGAKVHAFQTPNR